MVGLGSVEREPSTTTPQTGCPRAVEVGTLLRIRNSYRRRHADLRRGQITIPKPLRERFGMNHNVEVDITPTETGCLYASERPPSIRLIASTGCLATAGTPTTILKRFAAGDYRSRYQRAAGRVLADKQHGPSSKQRLRSAYDHGALIICDVVYAELAPAFDDRGALDNRAEGGQRGTLTTSMRPSHGRRGGAGWATGVPVDRARGSSPTS